MAIKRLLDGDDKAREEGFANYRNRLEKLTINGHHWNGEATDANPVYAVVDYGRWLANCECGGAEYVAATLDLFYCFSCGNAASGGKARRVIFPTPAERAAIERELMKRVMLEPEGLQGTQACLHSRPSDPSSALVRNWHPGETPLRLALENATKGGK
jgi:hypothetical protein